MVGLRSYRLLAICWRKNLALYATMPGITRTPREVLEPSMWGQRTALKGRQSSLEFYQYLVSSSAHTRGRWHSPLSHIVPPRDGLPGGSAAPVPFGHIQRVRAGQQVLWGSSNELIAENRHRGRTPAWDQICSWETETHPLSSDRTGETRMIRQGDMAVMGAAQPAT